MGISIISIVPILTLMLEDERGLGLIQIITGDGKGKTTSAMGLAVRAIGHGYRVIMVQFMKGQINYGELETAKKLKNFDIVQFGRPDFVDKDNPAEIDIKLAQEGLAYANKIIEENECDIIILDEINVAVDWKLIELEDVLRMIKSKPKNMELILTGRYADEKLIAIADHVSEIQDVKHPFNTGTMARRGIEF